LKTFRGKRHRIPQEELDYIVSRTDVVRLLDEFGLFASGQLRIRGNRVVGKCVMPHHPNPDNPTAFNFDIEKKLYYCFTKCHSGGDVIDFVMNYLQVDFLTAVEYLLQHVGLPKHGIQNFKNRIRQHVGNLPNLPKTEKTFREPPLLPEYEHLCFYPPAPEWVRREIGGEIAGVFDVRYTPNGFYRYRILWPVHDHRGRPVGMTGRTLLPVSESNPKWLHTPGMEKRHILFNYHRALQYRTKDVNEPLFIVEGPKDVVNLWKMGYRTVVALLGTSMSPEQGWLVNQFSRRIVLCLDNDKAGVKAMIAIGKFLVEVNRELKVCVVPLPKGRDPGDIDKKTFEAALDKMVGVERLIRLVE